MTELIDLLFECTFESLILIHIDMLVMENVLIYSYFDIGYVVYVFISFSFMLLRLQRL